MRCSTSSTRAASASSVSSGSTGTAPCAMIGPESISGTTKCTVAPCSVDAGLDRAAMRVEPLEGGQQRRVDVQQPAAPSRHEPRRQHPHESGEADDFDAVRFKHVLQGAFEAFAVLRKAGVIDDLGRDARRPRRAAGRRHPAGSKPPARSRPGRRRPCAASISAVMLEPRPEIRIAVRLRAMSVLQRKIERAGIADALIALRRHHLRRSRAALSPCSRSTASTASALSGATTAIMPIPQLKVRSISCIAMSPVCASHLKHRQRIDLRKIDMRAEMSSAARAGCCREIRRR